MKVVADDKVPFLQGVFQPFSEVVFLPGEAIDNASLRNADVLIVRSVTVCNEQLLRNTRVSFIASATIGHDHIDAAYCAANGIEWATAKGCNAAAVSQYVQAALWQAAAATGRDLKKETLAVIGVGNIGSLVSRVAKLYGMKVLQYDPPRMKLEGEQGFAGLEEVFDQAGFVSLHVPLTTAGEYPTKGMVNTQYLNSFKRDIVLINSSRGDVIDTNSLIYAMRDGKVEEAILDVWEGEPDINRELLRRCLVATPHIAGYSLDGKAMGSAMTVEAVSKKFELGLSAWFPDIKFDTATVTVDGKGNDDKAVWQKLYELVAPLQETSRSLKKDPETFLQLRRNYILRQDNKRWLVHALNCSIALADKIKCAEFQVIRK